MKLWLDGKDTFKYFYSLRYQKPLSHVNSTWASQQGCAANHTVLCRVLPHLCKAILLQLFLCPLWRQFKGCNFPILTSLPCSLKPFTPSDLPHWYWNTKQHGLHGQDLDLMILMVHSRWHHHQWSPSIYHQHSHGQPTKHLSLPSILQPLTVQPWIHADPQGWALTVSKLPLCIRSMGGLKRSASVVSFLSTAPPLRSSCSCRTARPQEERTAVRHTHTHQGHSALLNAHTQSCWGETLSRS